MKTIKSVRPETDYEKSQRYIANNDRLFFLIGLMAVTVYMIVMVGKCSG